MTEWTLRDLEYWDEKIGIEVERYGLDCYPQEFEICNADDMIGYMAYHGMPSHYPHWSFGKSFEQLRTMYAYGVQGLPYEMVINSDPCLAYLMRDNSLCLQVLTMAHVYGHNDFFKNNFTFTSATRASETLPAFKARAGRVRRYIEDPSIGEVAVERFLDAAHALSMNRRRNQAIRKPGMDEQREEARRRLEPEPDPFAHLVPKRPEPEPEPLRVPVEPEEDLLLFIRDHRPDLEDWQRDLLTIVDEEARYFLPQLETKIMNEGWASFWHYRIMSALDLPQELKLEFMVRHSQVICPHPGSLNPYHVGYKVWEDIEKRAGGVEDPDARARLFEVRETDRDAAFLRRFLTPELMQELDLFTWARRGENLVVDRISDEENWQEVRSKLIAGVGSAALPVIRIHDADRDGRRALYLVHEHDGRDLDMAHAEKTLGHLRELWGHDVLLETVLRGRAALMALTDAGFDARLVD